MTAQIFKLYYKSLIVLFPLLIIIGSFLVIDPFGIVHNKNPKYESSSDYQSTELYLKNTQTQNYNSFIFGNSKTLAFTSNDWQKYIGSQAFYKFGVPGESIFNIYNKIKLIQANGDQVQNAIVVLDLAMIKNFKNTSPFLQGPVYKHHPYTQDESWLSFYSTFFNYYLTDFFFLKVIRETFSGQSQTEKKDFLQTKEKFNALTNEFYLENFEKEIRANGFGNYYKNHAGEFQHPATSDHSEVLLNTGDVYYLSEIRKEFEQQNCNYKIILGPMWNSRSFPGPITKQLENIFGSGKVFDYSGYEKITKDSTYFYEGSHYRPVAGDLIFKEIYGSGNTGVREGK